MSPLMRRFDHRQAVGGMWEEIGRRQLEFLVEQGLEPHHELLDIGCGSLRAGIHFVGYLEPDRYCGLDIDERLLKAGQKELEQAGLADRGATLLQDARFRVDIFRRELDYAIAQSVFTHLPVNSIARCLREVERVLAPGGRFYATFNELDSRLGMTDRDPFRYQRDLFRWLVDESTLDYHYIGLWGHPRGTHPMVLFTKTG